MRIEVGEIFKPNWLMGLSNTPAISFNFPDLGSVPAYPIIFSVSILGQFRYARRRCFRVCPRSFSRTIRILPVSPVLTSATVTGNSTDSCAVCCRALFGEVLMSEFQKMCIVLKKMFKDVRGKRKGAYKVLLEKPEGRRPLGRPGRRLEDNVEMSLLKVGSGQVVWTGPAQRQVPYNWGYFSTRWDLQSSEKVS